MALTMPDLFVGTPSESEYQAAMDAWNAAAETYGHKSKEAMEASQSLSVALTKCMIEAGIQL